MATTTDTLGLHKSATTEQYSVVEDINNGFDIIDNQWKKGSDVASANSITVPDVLIESPHICGKGLEGIILTVIDRRVHIKLWK